ncbi:TetR/AcrR family transcriptional regulator [Oscillibacter sp.]|uniref:TetR/AcrR family transcriptional regulator n=1 Tax=Oscillibacter sp. TaxID=1945593 RepID=UPI00289B0237|nr:TetR/AcrR family transcriptional regulator [Oscillibacter sp.]
MSKISDRRRADILSSALTEFGLRGVDGASMSEIAARAGIGKSTIYEYFSSKTELLVASCEMKIRRMKEEIMSIFSRDSSFSEQMELYVEMMLEMAGNVDFNEVVRVFTRESLEELEPVVNALTGDVAAIMEQAILRGQATGELTQDLDVSIAAAILLGLPNPHLILRLRQLGKEEPVKALVNLALRGIRTTAAQENA